MSCFITLEVVARTVRAGRPRNLAARQDARAFAAIIFGVPHRDGVAVVLHDSLRDRKTATRASGLPLRSRAAEAELAACQSTQPLNVAAPRITTSRNRAWRGKVDTGNTLLAGVRSGANARDRRRPRVTFQIPSTPRVFGLPHSHEADDTPRCKPSSVRTSTKRYPLPMTVSMCECREPVSSFRRKAET